MRLIIIVFLLLFSSALFAQYEYEPNDQFPFGRLNPDAPKETADFTPMIGKCNCKAETRNPDGTWHEAIDMTWTFKYIMNGMDGSYRLTFYDMSETGYKWIGEWVDTQEKIVYPTWKIMCIR